MPRAASRRSPFAGNRGQGSKWIRPEKRHRIYARDGWKCIWCQCAVMCGSGVRPVGEPTDAAAIATLDHVLPRANGGTNDASNLLTACHNCNEKRGTRSAVIWAYAMRHGVRSGESWNVLERVITAMGTELPPAAKRLAAAA